MKKINLALAQLKSSFLNKKENYNRIKETIILGSSKGADYILFPELFTTGYSTDNGLKELAESLDSETITGIKKAAKEYNCGVIFGFAEKENNNLYNTAIFINKKGDTEGIYRKIHLFEFEQNIFTPGNSCPVFEIPEGKIGIMISEDMEYPEVSRIFAVNGAQLILVLCSNMSPSHPSYDIYLHARAMENHAFVASTNRVGLEGDNIYLGESIVINPTGTTIHKSSNNEDLPVVEIVFDETNNAKGSLNYLENRRPEIYLKEGIDK